MTTFLTPEPDLFRVWHLGVPEIDTAEWNGWTLTIGGLVDREIRLWLDELHSLPQTFVTAVHECAGNPLAVTIPQRRVGNVRWGGVALRDLLASAGIAEGASYVVSRGVDHGVFNGDHYDGYEKDVPLAKVLDGTVLVALTVNGEPLPVERGGPVRLVVPGFYGTNSTKWLTELVVAARRSSSAFTMRYYMDPPEQPGGAARPVWDLAPNSLLVGPVDGEVHSGRPVDVWGWAWAGEPLARVEVSTDGGATWSEAELEARSEHEWQRFTLPWTPRFVGEYLLACRATSVSGRTQPAGPARNQIHRRFIFVTLDEPRDVACAAPP